MDALKKKRVYEVGIRGLMGSLGILGVVWFMIPAVTHKVVNIGNITGVGVFVIIILYSIFFHRVHRLIGNIIKTTRGKILCITVGFFVLSVIIIFAFLALCMVKSSHKKPDKNTTLIVLGCRVYGEKASLMLTERVDAAYKYLQDNSQAICILSGGKGEGEQISEAECMRRMLTQKGISEDRLILEDKSTSTIENIKFSKEIIEEYNLGETVAIATSEVHEYRAGKIAEKENLIPSAVAAHTTWWLYPTFAIREMYGIVYEAIR